LKDEIEKKLIIQKNPKIKISNSKDEDKKLK
jgi:hypothetical protein